MKYITCREAHELWGNTERRIQQMCKNVAIEGSIKKCGSWLIPTDAVKHSVGVSDFKKAVSDYYYVDKTLLIFAKNEMDKIYNKYSRDSASAY